MPALAVQLGAIQKHPADFAVWSDPSPGQSGSYALKPIPGTRLASFVSYPKVPNAWRFGLEGFACARVSELGVEVVELHRGAGTHEDASWYRVKGGPLDGALVEVLVEETGGLCNAMPGTPEYWKFVASKLPMLASALSRYAP